MADIHPSLRRFAATAPGEEPSSSGEELLRFLSAAPEHAADVLGVHFDRWLRSPLGPRLTELVRLAVAQQTGCPVCQAIRRPGARRAGVDEALITAALSGGADGEDDDALTPRERLAVDYASALAGDHRSITPATYEALGRHFTEAEVAELALLAGSFLAQGRILETLTRGAACPVQR